MTRFSHRCQSTIKNNATYHLYSSIQQCVRLRFDAMSIIFWFHLEQSSHAIAHQITSIHGAMCTKYRIESLQFYPYLLNVSSIRSANAYVTLTFHFGAGLVRTDHQFRIIEMIIIIISEIL